MLNEDGHVSEGCGENIFMIRKGKLITPSPSDNVLEGITAATVVELARSELGLETVERQIDRTELYVCDELFMTGTAAHLTPVVEVDRRTVGNGRPGPLTTASERAVLRRHPRGKRPEVQALVHAGPRTRRSLDAVTFRPPRALGVIVGRGSPRGRWSFSRSR